MQKHLKNSGTDEETNEPYTDPLSATSLFRNADVLSMPAKVRFTLFVQSLIENVSTTDRREKNNLY